MKFHLDFETRSAVDLKKVGAWAYALHESTEILCMGYGSTPDNIIVARQDWITNRDTALHGIAAKPDLFISAHNAAFEYAIYNLILHRRYGWPARWNPKLWSCTMARAAMVGLPLSLDDLGRVLQIKTPKDLEGRRNMLQLSKPAGYDALGDPIYDNTPEKFKCLYAYNATDVLAEMEVDALLPELPESERRIWELDLIMNRRGVQIDTQFAAKAAGMSGALVADLNGRLRTMTNGAIDKATQTTAIKRYLTDHGVVVPTKFVDDEEKETIDKAAILDLLADPKLPPKVRDVIEIRQQVGKSTSTAKYAKALEMVCPDGRIRGSLQYHAAHTGRWGGRLLQPQNFPKGFDEIEQKKAIEMCLTGDTASFAKLYGVKSMSALSDALRGLIIAGPQKELISADFNAIEARGIFWLADDASALATYHRGDSPYVDMANYIYNRTDLTKKGNPKEYDLGKRTILGAGFGMGAAKFKITCKVQANIDISDELAERAIKAYREKYSAVVRMWATVEAAAISAVKNPGQAYAACGGKVLWGMNRDRRFLVCRLPSGRHLWYWKPAVRMGKTPWGQEKEEMVYWGQHPKTNEWCPLKTYGGALAENITQAVARDVMAHGMLNVEAAGYTMLLTVHDELLAEVNTPEDAQYRLADFISVMCKLPPWATGYPVAAEGWVGRRYKK